MQGYGREFKSSGWRTEKNEATNHGEIRYTVYGNTLSLHFKVKIPTYYGQENSHAGGLAVP